MSEARHSGLTLHTPDDGDAGELLKRRQIMRRTKIAAAVVLVLLVVGGGRTVISRIASAKTLEAGTAERAVNYVRTALPTESQGGQSVLLPGTLLGAVQAPIAARASGYLKRWTHDIGSRVQAGELLAEIDTPEIDQQLQQAQAARDQAAASLDLAHSTVERWEALRRKDVVSQQELDERRSAEVQARANLAAADANVQRLRQLEGFKRITAPFSGVLTRRNVDVGDLIDSGAGRPLFLMAQTDPLRVYVNVPQSSAQLVKPGQEVVVTQAELRARRFPGKVAHIAGAIDPATRTMQAEITLPNPEGVLLPGAYVQVALPLTASASLSIPSNTLLFRGEGTRVAVIDGQGKVTLHAVTLGRNNGTSVEVTSGLQANDRLVLNPPDSLVDGDVVTTQAPATAKAPA